MGHATLLESAFRVGRAVSVGVTTERFIVDHPKPFADRLQSYATRRRAVQRWVKARHPDRKVRVVPLSDPFGHSTDEGVDALVVSVDSLRGGRAVNAERRRLGRRPVPLVVVPVVLADDLQPVSSRRIRSGEIDRSGRRRAPMRVGVAASKREDRTALARAVRDVFPQVALVLVPTGHAGGPGPSRVQARSLAKRAVAGQELGVGASRDPRGGWQVVERTPSLELTPRSVPRGRSGALRRAVRALLSPPGGRKAF